jgi:hypothetical protein
VTSAQRDLITPDGNVQSVAWSEAELVAELLGEHDAAGLCEQWYGVRPKLIRQLSRQLSGLDIEDSAS